MDGPLIFDAQKTSGRPTRRANEFTPPLDVTASVALLFALAIAQPMLELLGRNAEFFVARDSSTIDIVILALITTFVFPGALAGLAIAAAWINPKVGHVVYVCTFVVLGVFLALQVIRHTPLNGLSWWAQTGIAVVTAAGMLILYRRSTGLQGFVRWGLLVPMVVAGLFLFSSTTSALIFREPGPTGAQIDVASPPPIVFLLFDALSVSDLMDEHGRIQGDLYPNFARLAQDGSWFRNAITVHYRTETSVPALLSGLTTTPGALPIERDHPHNLFTLLGDSYDIWAEEPITQICPDRLCTRTGTAGLMERWQGLVNDVRVVAGHVLLPVDLSTWLPPVDETWGNFGPLDESVAVPGSGEGSEGFDFREGFQSAVIDQDRREAISRFVAGLQTNGTRPTLNFLHAVLPHGPWIYLPTGQRHDLPNGRFPSRRLEDGWVDDSWMMDQVYQLHLLQVQYADTIIGLVLERLDAQGAYGDALIVVMSDHGESFRPGVPFGRPVEVIDDILPVPLFIKAPRQQIGVTDDYRALTLDVVPTIADILGIELPWSADGVSLIGAQRPVRGHTEVETSEGPILIDSTRNEAVSRAQQKIERFGPDGPFGLAPDGYRDLLATPIDSLALRAGAPRKLILREPTRLADVNPEADVLPITVRGSIDGADGEELIVALSLNGEIVAVTRSYTNANGANVFDALLPPEALRPGKNHLQLIEVSGRGTSRTFHPLG